MGVVNVNNERREYNDRRNIHPLPVDVDSFERVQYFLPQRDVVEHDSAFMVDVSFLPSPRVDSIGILLAFVLHPTYFLCARMVPFLSIT